MTANLPEFDNFTKHLVERLPFPLFVSSKCGTLTVANPAMQKATGYALQELLQNSITSLFQDASEVQKLWQEPVSADTLTATAQLRFKSGGVTPFQLLAWRLFTHRIDCIVGLLLPDRRTKMSVEAIDARERIRVLSERQRQVFDLAAAGVPNKSIAQELDISIKTVEMHRAQVMKKLQVSNLAGLVRLAVVAELFSE